MHGTSVALVYYTIPTLQSQKNAQEIVEFNTYIQMQIGNLLSLLVREHIHSHSDRTNSTQFGWWTRTVRALEHPNEGICLLCVACRRTSNPIERTLINYVH